MEGIVRNCSSSNLDACGELPIAEEGSFFKSPNIRTDGCFTFLNYKSHASNNHNFRRKTMVSTKSKNIDYRETTELVCIGMVSFVLVWFFPIITYGARNDLVWRSIRIGDVENTIHVITSESDIDDGPLSYDAYSSGKLSGIYVNAHNVNTGQDLELSPTEALKSVVYAQSTARFLKQGSQLFLNTVPHAISYGEVKDSNGALYNPWVPYWVQPSVSDTLVHGGLLGGFLLLPSLDNYYQRVSIYRDVIIEAVLQPDPEIVEIVDIDGQDEMRIPEMNYLLNQLLILPSVKNHLGHLTFIKKLLDLDKYTGKLIIPKEDITSFLNWLAGPERAAEFEKYGIGGLGTGAWKMLSRTGAVLGGVKISTDYYARAAKLQLCHILALYLGDARLNNLELWINSTITVPPQYDPALIEGIFRARAKFDEIADTGFNSWIQAITSDIDASGQMIVDIGFLAASLANHHPVGILANIAWTLWKPLHADFLTLQRGIIAASIVKQLDGKDGNNYKQWQTILTTMSDDSISTVSSVFQIERYLSRYFYLCTSDFFSTFITEYFGFDFQPEQRKMLFLECSYWADFNKPAILQSREPYLLAWTDHAYIKETGLYEYEWLSELLRIIGIRITHDKNGKYQHGDTAHIDITTGNTSTQGESRVSYLIKSGNTTVMGPGYATTINRQLQVVFPVDYLGRSGTFRIEVSASHDGYLDGFSTLSFSVAATPFNMQIRTNQLSLTSGPKSTSNQNISVLNTGEASDSVTVTKSGEIASWIGLSQSQFILDGYEAKNYEFTLSVPDGIPFRQYTGTISFQSSGQIMNVAVQCTVVDIKPGDNSLPISGFGMVDGTPTLNTFNDYDETVNDISPTTYSYTLPLSQDQCDRTSRLAVYIKAGQVKDNINALDCLCVYVNGNRAYPSSPSNYTQVDTTIEISEYLHAGNNEIQIAMYAFANGAGKSEWSIQHFQIMHTLVASVWKGTLNVDQATLNTWMAGYNFSGIKAHVNQLTKDGGVRLYVNGKLVQDAPAKAFSQDYGWWIINNDRKNVLSTSNTFLLRGNTSDQTKVTYGNVEFRMVYYIGDPLLDVSKSVDKDKLVVGDTATVTVYIKNIGANIASAVVSQDTVPSEFENVAGSLKGNLSTIQPDQSETFQYTIRALKAGPLNLPLLKVTYKNPSNTGFETDSHGPLAINVSPAPEPVLQVSILFDNQKQSYGQGEMIGISIVAKDQHGNPVSSSSPAFVKWVIRHNGMDYLSGSGQTGDGGEFKPLLSASRQIGTYEISAVVSKTGFTDGSVNATFTVLDTTPPTVPTILTPADNSSFADNQPEIVWTKSLDGESQNVSYRLEISQDSNFNNLLTQNNLTETSWTPANVMPDGSYFVRVRAKDDASTDGNWSDWSSVVSFTVDTIAPGTIELHAATGNDPGSVILQWTATGNNGQSGAASRYSIRYANTAITDDSWEDANSVPNSIVPQSSGEAEEFTVTGLKCDKDYFFAIRAVDPAGNYGCTSNSPTARSGKMGPCIPSEPFPADQSKDIGPVVTLTWKCATEDHTPSQYSIFFGIVEPNMIMVPIAENLSVNSYELHDLKQDTRYAWKVKSTDGLTETEGKTWEFKTKPLSADLNGDGVVNTADLVSLASHWLWTCDQPNGCDGADIDWDGVVNLSDILFLSNQWTRFPLPQNFVFIPYGDFLMGDSLDEGESDEKPLHQVQIGLFAMMIYEVTNEKYADGLNWAFKQDMIRTDGERIYCNITDKILYDLKTYDQSQITWNGNQFGVVPGKEKHPVLMVTWYGAASYANWCSQREGYIKCYNLPNWDCDFTKIGYRLPTEAEWEYAARGGQQDPYWRYPWGNDLDGEKANYKNSNNPYHVGKYPWTSPVDYYPPYGYGLHDIMGNVWEWCNDWYDSSYYSECFNECYTGCLLEYCLQDCLVECCIQKCLSECSTNCLLNPRINPHGPVSGDLRVCRGGAYGSASTSEFRIADRSYMGPEISHGQVGFRLVLATH
jgi:uncharacterized repeat protein (TIGR01451 family)